MDGDAVLKKKSIEGLKVVDADTHVTEPWDL